MNAFSPTVAVVQRPFVQMVKSAYRLGADRIAKKVPLLLFNGVTLPVSTTLLCT